MEQQSNESSRISRERDREGPPTTVLQMTRRKRNRFVFVCIGTYDSGLSYVFTGKKQSPHVRKLHICFTSHFINIVEYICNFSVAFVVIRSTKLVSKYSMLIPVEAIASLYSLDWRERYSNNG